MHAHGVPLPCLFLSFVPLIFMLLESAFKTWIATWQSTNEEDLKLPHVTP